MKAPLVSLCQLSVWVLFLLLSGTTAVFAQDFPRGSYEFLYDANYGFSDFQGIDQAPSGDYYLLTPRSDLYRFSKKRSMRKALNIKSAYFFACDLVGERNGFTVLGISSSGYGCLARFDSSGTLIWGKTYGGSDFGTPSVLHKNVSGHYFFAHKSSRGISSIVKIDSNGNSIWARRLLRTSGSLHYFSRIYWNEPTRDGGVIMSIAADTSMYLVRLDSMGNTVWQRRAKNYVCYRARELANGDFLFCGFNEREYTYYVLRTNPDGGILWVRTIVPEDTNSNSGMSVSGVVETSAGTIQVYGRYFPSSRYLAPTIGLAELTPSGSVISGYDFGNEGDNTFISYYGDKIDLIDRESRLHILGRNSPQNSSYVGHAFWKVLTTQNNRADCVPNTLAFQAQEYSIPLVQSYLRFADTLVSTSDISANAVPAKACYSAACEGSSYPRNLLGPTRVFCEGDSIHVKLDVSLVPGPYWWSTRDTTPTITVTKPGNYRVYTNNLCDYQENITIVRQPSPEPLWTRQVDLSVGDSFTLPLPPDPSIVYTWEPDQPHLKKDAEGRAYVLAPPNTTGRPFEDYTFRLRISDTASACRAIEDRFLVRVHASQQVLPDTLPPYEPISAPGVVIPGHQDAAYGAWIVKGLDQFPHHTLTLFNVHGVPVYQASPYRNDWTGNELAQGMYFYSIEVEGGQYHFKGRVALVK